jgi:hypothetical protein
MVWLGRYTCHHGQNLCFQSSPKSGLKALENWVHHSTVRGLYQVRALLPSRPSKPLCLEYISNIGNKEGPGFPTTSNL